ncbi:MAG: twin-arginine translocation signal domain-containing protein [Planctomycetes bacterium]|nr:twin-arginine translocation signal domain-containing protein [Planctomycetota bacterium]
MGSEMNRRTFIKESLLASAGGALALGAGAGKASAADARQPKANAAAGPPPAAGALPMGKIGKLQVSRMLLGGNLLTHYTHSRDLKYVYNLCAHYNTDAKIMETLALAEQHGINTVSMHNPPAPMAVLRRYRKQGGKIQWIICPTAPIEDNMQTYTDRVRQLVEEDGCEAIYVWGVRSDPLAAQGKMNLLAKAVEIAKDHGVPSGVGCHSLKAVEECEKAKIPADFYIKTFHHHKYPSGPKPEQIKGPYSENPGYWCADPQGTADFMKTVEKPWIAFKIMAAGAIPPADAFAYALNNGADHILVGMFDFEIAEDVGIAKKALAAAAKRSRPWRS